MKKRFTFQLFGVIVSGLLFLASTFAWFTFTSTWPGYFPYVGGTMAIKNVEYHYYKQDYNTFYGQYNDVDKPYEQVSTTFPSMIAYDPLYVMIYETKQPFTHVLLEIKVEYTSNVPCTLRTNLAIESGIDIENTPKRLSEMIEVIGYPTLSSTSSLSNDPVIIKNAMDATLKENQQYYAFYEGTQLLDRSLTLQTTKIEDTAEVRNYTAYFYYLLDYKTENYDAFAQKYNISFDQLYEATILQKDFGFDLTMTSL